MKIGIISDIHSNIDALESVFNEFEKLRIDNIICLGDFIGLGPYPEKCVELLMKNKHKLLAIIKGNHERYLTEGITRLNHTDVDVRPMSDEDVKLLKWNHARINNKEVEYIKSLNNREELIIEGKKILVEHYSMKDERKFKKFIQEPNLKELEELYKDKEADIYLFGHTHKRIYEENNEKYYINPGALGCPKGKPYADAGILEIKNSEVKYTALRVKYDYLKVIEDIKKFNYTKSTSIINTFYSETK